ncbi:MAG: hypothetical protein AB7Q42_09825 [Acidimicrobiia bacterium]
MTSIVELELSSEPAAWRRIGLEVVDDRSQVGLVGLRFTGGSSGISGWTLSGDADDALTIDGLPTRIVAPSVAVPPPPVHPLGATRIDHIVVTTSSLERTCDAIESATGEPLKRVRDAGPGIRQGFHRFGEVIVEVVERADLPAGTGAAFWGLVLVVEGDLFDACARLGPELVGLPKEAVQRGRFIATVRNELGLGLPVALMTP